MLETRKNAIKFNSSNGSNQIAGYWLEHETVRPKAILQISHGMCEYFSRYDDFAAFMAQHGYLVCGNDHLGHGQSAPDGEEGFFAAQDGADYVLRDLYQMNALISRKYPGLPVFLLGHSMGSFFARRYAVLYPETIKALILSGTAGPNPMAKVGIALTEMLSKTKGPQYRSRLVYGMAFGQYLKKIPHPATPYDWITRDEEIVHQYAGDPKCTFLFSVSAFHDLMRTLDAVSSQRWANRLPKALPIALFAGDMDPVGDYGKGVRKVYQMLRKAGVKDVEMKLYHGARHEILNETNRQEVYADVLAWCEKHIETL